MTFQEFTEAVAIIEHQLQEAKEQGMGNPAVIAYAKELRDLLEEFIKDYELHTHYCP